jgi:hypothetical protein
VAVELLLSFLLTALPSFTDSPCSLLLFFSVRSLSSSNVGRGASLVTAGCDGSGGGFSMLEEYCCLDAEETGAESMLDTPSTSDPHHAVFVAAL